MIGSGRMQLELLEDTFAIARLGPADPIPVWAVSGSLLSITRTRDELSIVCVADRVPPEVRCRRGWRCLKVEGPLDFELVGVLASLAAPLARAGVAIFVISAFDTDYVLVGEASLVHAIAALKATGHTIDEM